MATRKMNMIPIGTLVFDSSGSEYVYRGPADMAGMQRLTFDLRNGGPTGINTDMDQVAPLEALANVNLKDPRITVTKMAEKPRYAPGPWLHRVELPTGVTHEGWHKTKRDAIADSAHRLAIADWHQQEESQEDENEGWWEGGLLLDALEAQGVKSAWVWQSGGGTATFMLPNESTGLAMLVGPGSYHWADSRKSLFTMDELSYAIDHNDWYERFGLDADEPENFDIDPSSSIEDAAKQIAEQYRKFNELYAK